LVPLPDKPRNANGKRVLQRYCMIFFLLSIWLYYYFVFFFFSFFFFPDLTKRLFQVLVMRELIVRTRPGTAAATAPSGSSWRRRQTTTTFALVGQNMPAKWRSLEKMWLGLCAELSIYTTSGTVDEN
jgi:hypothetical protein